MADVCIQNEGTIFLFTPNTDAGREWIDEHVAGETTNLGLTLVVEHRYALGLAQGMAKDGLELE